MPRAAAAGVARQPRRRASAASGCGTSPRSVGLDFRHGAFRYQVTTDPVAMMGGGVCWLDYDGDGWLDLYAVNSYTDLDAGRFEQAGGLPRNALFHNVGGRFVDVSRGSGADLALRGNGCVAADLERRRPHRPLRDGRRLRRAALERRRRHVHRGRPGRRASPPTGGTRARRSGT